MIYAVRTRSGGVYLTRATEPSEAMNAKGDWRTVTFSLIHKNGEETGHVMVLRGDALESVTIMSGEDGTT